MNILFLMKLMHIGGQEMVTITLANYFAIQGHRVSIVSFEKPWDEAVNRTNSSVHFYTLGTFKNSKKNVKKLNEILCKESVDVVINQWGLPFTPTKVLNAAIKKGGSVKPDIKTIAIYHNDPQTNARIKDVEISLENCSNPLKRMLLIFKKKIFAKITSRSMRYVYNHCDQYQVLSQSYIEGFRAFTGVTNASHVIAQTNPVTIDTEKFVYGPDKKYKEIIYCGRIDFNQKRVCRLIEIWSYLEVKFPDWRLVVVGDGESRKDLENQVKKFKLQNVLFEGFQKPLEYYKRASILALTSEYEGFPLVLAECMSFGVVPCIYDSFAAVYDIIEDEINGLIIGKINGKFSAKEMATRLAEIMTNEQKLDMMAQKAIETSKRYSIDSVYEQWMENLNVLLQSK